MVKETVSFAWNNMSVHVPPEVPLSLKDQIQYLAPGWEILRPSKEEIKPEDYTLIGSKSQRTYIISTPQETRAMCIGDYGRNLGSIKNIGETIKRLAKFSKRKDVPKKLAEKICAAVIACESLPSAVKIGNRPYRIKPKKNLTLIKCLGTFYEISREYEQNISNMFEFP